MYKTYKGGLDYKIYKVCGYCGKRFEQRHRLRKYCDDCRLKVSGVKPKR